MLVNLGVAKLMELVINDTSGDTARRKNAENSRNVHAGMVALTWGLAAGGNLQHLAMAPAATAVHTKEAVDEHQDMVEAEQPQANYYEMGLDQSVDVSQQQENHFSGEMVKGK